MTNAFKKKKLYIIILIIVAFFAIAFGFLKIREIRAHKSMRKYSRINNWKDAKEIFKSDVEKNELKYFTFGLSYNTDLDSLESKYNLDVIFMGDIIHNSYLLYDFYVATEIIRDHKFRLPYRTVADSIWDYFQRAMETSDVAYLIANSMDSISCSELDIPGRKNNEIYESKFIFNNYLDQLMHLDDFSSYRQNIHETDSMININYFIESKNSEEKGYNLIFYFIKKGDIFLFSGMLLT